MLVVRLYNQEDLHLDLQYPCEMLGRVAQAPNPSTREAEAGDSMGLTSQQLKCNWEAFDSKTDPVLEIKLEND